MRKSEKRNWIDFGLVRTISQVIVHSRITRQAPISANRTNTKGATREPRPFAISATHCGGNGIRDRIPVGAQTMRLSLNVIVILTIPLLAVAMERPNSTPAKDVTARSGSVTQPSDTELLVQTEKDK